MNPILKNLIDGNKRFSQGNPDRPNQDENRIKEVVTGQKPFAIIISCSDSRVPPEIIFDCGIGDIFSVRTAGHVVDDVAMASVEYAVEHLGCKLIVVLGHSSCGAVKAAIENITSGVHLPGSIAKLVMKIRPSIKTSGSGYNLSESIIENIRLTIELLKLSPIVSCEILANNLEIAGLFYNLESGIVETIP